MRPGSPAGDEAQMLGPEPEGDAARRHALGGQRDAAGADGAVGGLAADQVDRRRADEAGDEQALRPQVEVVRGADLLDPAGAHADDAVGHGGGLDLVVGDEDRGHPEPLLQRLDLGAHGQPERRVEVRQRLVEQQELRLLDQRAGERHPLLLAARELARPPVQQLADMHEVGRRPHPADRLVARGLLEAQREADVVAHRHVRIERVGLEDDADVAVAGLDLVDEVAVEAQLAAARQVDAGQHEERRRLAAAGGPEQRHELAVLDRRASVRGSPRHRRTASRRCGTRPVPRVSPSPRRSTSASGSAARRRRAAGSGRGRRRRPPRPRRSRPPSRRRARSTCRGSWSSWCCGSGR